MRRSLTVAVSLLAAVGCDRDEPPEPPSAVARAAAAGDEHGAAAVPGGDPEAETPPDDDSGGEDSAKPSPAGDGDDPSERRERSTTDADTADASGPEAAAAKDGEHTTRGDTNDRRSDPMALAGSISTAVGGPRSGRLEGGVALPMEGPGFRFNPRRRPQARYATVEVVQALMRAAAVVDRHMPGGELTVNDLSLEQGGPIAHHGSHRNGRDVDTLFYLTGADGEPVPSVGAPLDPEGAGWDFKDLADPSDDVRVRIDLPRTWRFVQALFEDPGAHLQRIYVAEHLRAMLLEHAREADAPRKIVRKFALITCQPSYPHDDHFHFRFFCTPEDIRAGCEDSLPIYPWHRRHLRKAGVEPVVERPDPDRERAKITTHEQAREQAGKMHARVEAFLDRREAWLDKPHPGRPYCP